MLRARGYQILLLNFRDPQNGNAWNPMSLPYKMYKTGKQDKAIELLDDLALNILYDDSNKNADPFWEKTSADYFSGVALGLFEDAKPEEININSISLATTVGEENLVAQLILKNTLREKILLAQLPSMLPLPLWHQLRQKEVSYRYLNKKLNYLLHVIILVKCYRIVMLI